MSLYDLFRGFFGFRGARRPRDPFFGGITRDDEDEDDEDEDAGPSFGARHPDDFAFGFTFGPGGMRFHDSFGFDELFQDFNDLFSEMGARSLPLHPFGGQELPGVEAPPPADRPPGRRQTLRDSMLKYPDSQRFSRRALEDGSDPAAPEGRPWLPFPGRAAGDVTDTSKEDRDLDSHVTSEGLETVLLPPQPRSYFKSVSVTKVIAPDGTIEERRTVRDSQGREETVVTRRGGGEHGGGQQGGPADVLPFDSHHREDMSDSWSILDTFFRRWFSSR